MAYLIQPEYKKKWADFMADAKKSAGYMSTEFQRRRAAYQFARAQESTTGALDMRKLASYKTRDDIFRSNISLPNAQSHGMFMLIDHSASMHRIKGAVAERVIELAEFCRISSIPFVVYGFTSGIGAIDKCHSNVTDSISMSRMCISEIFNSTLKPAAFAEAALDYWYCNNRSYMGCESSIYDGSQGTPLLESLILTHSLARDFKRRTGVQKLNIIVISDGDGNQLTNVQNTEGKSVTAIYGGAKLELELNGKRLLLKPTDYHSCYTSLIKNLRETLDAKVICFFLFTNQRPDIMIRHGSNFKGNDIQIVNDKIYGYDMFIGMRASALEIDTFGEDADALLKKKTETRAARGKDASISVGDIRAAFTRAAVNRTERNQFAQKFIQMIA